MGIGTRDAAKAELKQQGVHRVDATVQKAKRGRRQADGNAAHCRSYSSSARSSAPSDSLDSSSNSGTLATPSSFGAPGGPNYERVFGTMQHAPGVPAFVWIKG